MGCGCSKNVKKVNPIKTINSEPLSGSVNKARVASPVRRVIKKRAR